MQSKQASIRAYVDELRMLKQLGKSMDCANQVMQLFGPLADASADGPQGKSMVIDGLARTDPHFAGNVTQRTMSFLKSVPVYDKLFTALGTDIREELLADRADDFIFVKPGLQSR